MLDFRPMNVADVGRIAPRLLSMNDISCEYSPACLMMWGKAELAECGGFFIPHVTFGDYGGYLRPIGEGDFRTVLPELEADARRRGVPFCMFGVAGEARAQLEETGRYRFETNSDYYDYVYSIDALCTLSGSKLQPKRNHINRFIAEHGDWCCEEIDAAAIDECRELCEQWYSDHAAAGVDISAFDAERGALALAFDNYGAIGFDGMVLRTEGRVIAFSMGNRLSREIYDVNFEKAVASIQGAYALINREFSRMIREKYPEVRWLDREDDMGLPGLRKAKQSYYPAFLIEKYNALLAEETP